MWSPISFPNESAVALCLALALSACARETPAKGDSSAVPAIPSDARAASTEDGCPKSGLWQPCNVLDRLEAAGLVVTTDSQPARFPFFSVEGTTYSTTRSTIHVFLYPDPAARKRDSDALDSTSVAPRGGSYTWPSSPTLVTSNNMAAVVISPNERQVERIVLALSAGLPPGRQ